MADYTYEQLKGMTVAQLRQIADGIKGDESLQGHSVMHKEQLLPLLCKALHVEVHHVAIGAGKMRMKAAIRKLKAQRDEAAKTGQPAKLPAIRHQVHVLKRKLRRMAEQKT